MQWHATKLAPGSVLHAMACDQACQGASCMHRHVTKPARERPACGGHVAKLAAGVGPRLWRQCVCAQRSWPCSPGPRVGQTGKLPGFEEMDLSILLDVLCKTDVLLVHIAAPPPRASRGLRIASSVFAVTRVTICLHMHCTVM